MQNGLQRPVLEVLLGLDSPGRRAWERYEDLGIGPEHVPKLIRIATDPELLWAETDSPESWAPVHAWRALGQLRSEAAVTPLVQLLAEADGDDWIIEELPKVFELIGRPAVGELAKYLTGDSTGIFDRAVAAAGLKKIALRDPDYRTACIETIRQVVGRYEVNSPVFNALIIGDLIDLKAVEAADAMKAAFEADRVDIRQQGDWEDVQIELGLLSERLTPRRPFPFFDASPPSPPPGNGAARSHVPKARAKKKKSKRKDARRSRNRNRRGR